MSGVLRHSDPYKIPAGLLTLAVHCAFFVLLYVGVSWHAEPLQGMVVDLWDSSELTPPAPSEQSAPPPEAQKVEAPPPPKPVEAAKPEVPLKAEIDLAEKKKKAKAKEAVKPEPKRKLTKAEQRQAQAEMQEAIKQQELAEQQARAAQAAQATKAAQAAAIAGKTVDEYAGKIRAKIRRNIVIPPDVADDALAEFDVTLLPGGEVLDAKLVRKSGNAAYDAAVERAIWKSSPLPVPSDADLFDAKFRSFHLKFRPKDRE